MADNPVYRNYLDSYLGGQGNGLPVYRVGGSDAGKPLFKNQWKIVITRKGIFTGTLYLPQVWVDYSNDRQELFTRAAPVNWFGKTASSDAPSFVWESSTTRYYNPPAAGEATYYRKYDDHDTVLDPGIYGTGRADGNCPVDNGDCLGWPRGGDAYGLGFPAYVKLDHPVDTFTSAGGPFENWICIVYPWWGSNNATKDVGHYGRSHTQAEMNLPEGKWGLLVQTCSRTFIAYVNNVRTEMSLYSCALYVSTQTQHKAAFPWAPGREAVTFTYSRLLDVPDHNIDLNGQLLVSSREDFYRSQTFELSAEPV